MTHEDFVRAYHAGEIRIDIERKVAARFVSARLLLPFVFLPVLGVGTALALLGWLWTGFAIIGIGTLVPMLIKASAANFVMAQSLADERFYRDAYAAGTMHIVEVNEGQA